MSDGSEGAVAGEEEEGVWPLEWGRRGRPALGDAAAAARRVDDGGGSAGQPARVAVQGERRCTATSRGRGRAQVQGEGPGGGGSVGGSNYRAPLQLRVKFKGSKFTGYWIYYFGG